MSERTLSDSDIIEQQRQLLKVYRYVSGYTIGAVEGAIDNLMDAITKEQDEGIKRLLNERLKTLESNLQTITTDYE